jgi:hypothetical protein
MTPGDGDIARRHVFWRIGAASVKAIAQKVEALARFAARAYDTTL